MRLIIGLLTAAVPSFAFMFGNPGQPWLMTDGILFDYHLCSLRAAFLDDYVYSQCFEGQAKLDMPMNKPPIARLSSETALISANIARRLDINGIVGNARLELDREFYFENQIAWGVGAKALLFQGEKILIGCDVKTFQTDQKPTYIVSTGIPLGIASDFIFSYQEYQAALGISYLAGLFSPYILGTYIFSKIVPSRYILLRIPGMPGLFEPEDRIPTFFSRNDWGVAVGATLRMSDKGTLSIESRFLNQNAIDASLEMRF
jgi:hypothetical protein